MEIKKILVPVDGSDASKRAFKMAVDVAKVHGAELVVTCIADVSEAAYPIMGVTLDKNGFINIKAKAERLLAALKEEIPLELDYEEIVETGIPGAGITEIVEQQGIDMVVIGNSGKGAVSSFVMGSVSQYVIHHVKCPVLVVK